MKRQTIAATRYEEQTGQGVNNKTCSGHNVVPNPVFCEGGIKETPLTCR